MRAFTRDGYDWWPITLTASVIPFKGGIIDGEVVVLDDQHRSSFNECRQSFPAAGRTGWCSSPSVNNALACGRATSSNHGKRGSSSR